MADEIYDDNIQHGIDDNPAGDAEKGATLGGIGGAVTGAVAGAAAGPIGAVAGAVIGGVAGAVASGAAVAAIDRHDNDNTISGLGTGATYDVDEVIDDETVYDHTYLRDADGNLIRNADGTYARDWNAVPLVDSGIPVAPVNTDYDSNKGINRMESLGETTPSLKTGGYANDGTPDTRGIGEKVVDSVTGDVIDDKTGKVVNHP
jgi:hypothetical protein